MIHLHEASIDMGGGWFIRTVIRDSPFLNVSRHKGPGCKLMISLRLPLLSEAYFSISTPRRWKAENWNRALAERQLSGRLRGQTFRVYSYLWANTHTDRQANTCVREHNWKGERQRSPPTPTGLAAWEFFNKAEAPLPRLLCSLFLTRMHVFASLPFVSKCVLTRWECARMFLFRWHACLFWGIPVFGLYTSWVDTHSDSAFQVSFLF